MIFKDFLNPLNEKTVSNIDDLSKFITRHEIYDEFEDYKVHVNTITFTYKDINVKVKMSLGELTISIDGKVVKEVEYDLISEDEADLVIDTVKNKIK